MAVERPISKLRCSDELAGFIVFNRSRIGDMPEWENLVLEARLSRFLDVRRYWGLSRSTQRKEQQDENQLESTAAGHAANRVAECRQGIEESERRVVLQLCR
jgi:hypothetical protein